MLTDTFTTIINEPVTPNLKQKLCRRLLEFIAIDATAEWLWEHPNSLNPEFLTNLYKCASKKE